jgi:hypothetical protein
MAQHRIARDGTVGPATRPVAVPDDVDAGGAKAAGVVELPVTLRWSHPRRTYDLSDPTDRALVYEQVLTEGTERDVRRFIDVDELVRLWNVLVLPEHVRAAWAKWISEHRDVVLPC